MDRRIAPWHSCSEKVMNYGVAKEVKTPTEEKKAAFENMKTLAHGPRSSKVTVLLPLLAGVALGFSGCAYMHSTTVRSTDPKNGTVTETTSARAYALFDSNAALTKFVNRSGYVTGTNVYAPGTYVTGLNESASTTNLVNIISAVAQGVANGLRP